MDLRPRMVQVPVQDDGPIGRLPMMARWLLCYLMVRGADGAGAIHLPPGELHDAIGFRFGVDVGGRRVLRRLLPLMVQAGSVVRSEHGVVLPEWSAWNKHGQVDPWRRAYRAEPGRLADASVFARGALIYLLKVVSDDGTFDGVPLDARAVVHALLRRRGGREGWALDRALVAPVQELIDAGHVVPKRGQAAILLAGPGRRDAAAAATQPPPDDHATATQSPPDDHAVTTQSPPDDHAKRGVTPRKDYGDAPSVFLSSLPLDVRSPAAEETSRTTPMQLVLTMPEPPPPKPSRRRRATAPAAEAPPPDSMPRARALYDAIMGDPILRDIVALPADFAMRMEVMFPDLDLAFLARDAGEFLARPSTSRPTDGRRFLRHQFTSVPAHKLPRATAQAPAAAPAAGALAPRPTASLGLTYDPLARPRAGARE